MCAHRADPTSHFDTELGRTPSGPKAAAPGGHYSGTVSGEGEFISARSGVLSKGLSRGEDRRPEDGRFTENVSSLASAGRDSKDVPQPNVLETRGTERPRQGRGWDVQALVHGGVAGLHELILMEVDVPEDPPQQPGGQRGRSSHAA